MNSKFVMVPREVGEAAWQALDDDGRFEESCPLREALDQPAEQHQGEPVGWQFYQDGKWWNGDDRIKDHRKNTEDAGYPVRDVFAHADPGEVERLRKLATDLAGGDIADLEETRRANAHLTGDLQTAEQERDTLRAQLAEMTTKRDRLREGLDNANINIYNWFKDNQKLEAQLAERDALLRDLVSMDIPRTAAAIERAKQILSASAEPSAPTVHPINMKTIMQAYEQVDHKALLHGTSNWCAAMATALRGVLERKS